MYYLQSRYYNPEWSRFINADGITGVHGELLSHNMFAYCDNEPVNRHDPSGFIWDFLDIGFAALSWADFARKPSMGGLALALVDTVAAGLPVVPSTGYVRGGAKVADKVAGGIKGYKPQAGERTLEGFFKNNVLKKKEISLNTNSAGFNNNRGNIGGEFKRFGAGSHGGVSPHVHQPMRNTPPNGNIYGGVGKHTSDGGVTSPTRRDIKQLYQYLYNGKYQ